MLAGGRIASGEGSVTQFADSRVATACCFAGRVDGAGSAAVLVKVLGKFCTEAVVVTCYCCHFSHDGLATWLFFAHDIVTLFLYYKMSQVVFEAISRNGLVEPNLFCYCFVVC